MQIPFPFIWQNERFNNNIWNNHVQFFYYRRKKMLEALIGQWSGRSIGRVQPGAFRRLTGSRRWELESFSSNPVQLGIDTSIQHWMTRWLLAWFLWRDWSLANACDSIEVHYDWISATYPSSYLAALNPALKSLSYREIGILQHEIRSDGISWGGGRSRLGG